MPGGTGICYGIFSADLSGSPSLGQSLLPEVSLSLTCYTSPKLEAVVDRTAQAPLLGLFGAFVKEWIPLINEYHYCKSHLLSHLRQLIMSPFISRHISLGLRSYHHFNVFCNSLRYASNVYYLDRLVAIHIAAIHLLLADLNIPLLSIQCVLVLEILQCISQFTFKRGNYDM